MSSPDIRRNHDDKLKNGLKNVAIITIILVIYFGVVLLSYHLL